MTPASAITTLARLSDVYGTSLEACIISWAHPQLDNRSTPTIITQVTPTGFQPAVFCQKLGIQTERTQNIFYHSVRFVGGGQREGGGGEGRVTHKGPRVLYN
jgi:hypothetical protein